MRTSLRLTMAALGLMIATGPAHATLPAPITDQLVTRYLDGLFAAKPHLATYMGDHRFDDKLPDLTPAALARRHDELVALRGELEQRRMGRKSVASLDEVIDAEILGDGIALELLYLDEIRDWQWDPRLNDSFPYYDPREIIASRLSDIVHGTFAPEAARRKSVIAQLDALPAFLAAETDQLRHGWRHPAREYLDAAIGDNAGRIAFFKSDVAPFVKGDAAGEAALTRALAALGDYQTFLTGDLRALVTASPGDWRLGKALYAKKFALALGTELTPEQASGRAQAAFAEARKDLYAIAVRLHEQLWPQEPAVAANADKLQQARLISRVKDELSKEHPAAADLVAAHGRDLDALRAFIVAHDVIGLPGKETLDVQPMPAFKRGSSAAEYLAPGMLDRTTVWRATYYVDPIDPTWPAERVESYLRGQNVYEVQLTAAHEAYPGHHTQNFYAKRSLNPLRAVLWNAAMAEGWAVYGEGQMVTDGWGASKNDRFKFFDTRGRMIVATNLMLDRALQSGQMTDDEAVRFMVEEGFQERATSEKKLLRAKLDSTQLAQYFLGLSEIESLERDVRKKLGGAKWKARTFNEALVGHGTIAVKYLRRYLSL
jgi:hypothetical protein